MAFTSAFSDTNLCETLQNYCKDNLGISRSEMPQLEAKETQELLKFYNMSTEDAQLKSIMEVKFTQNEISGEKTEGIAKWFQEGSNAEKFYYIVSVDGYLLDGHHRLSAHRLLCLEGIEQFCMASLIIVPVSITELLDRAMSYSLGSRVFQK